MGKEHFSEEQIAFALRQAESGTSVAGVIRKLGISEQTFSRWKKRSAGLGIARVAAVSDSRRGESEAQAAGGGPEPRQEDAARRPFKKTMRPAVQRVLVRDVQVADRFAELRACRVLGFSRTTCHREATMTALH